MQNVLADVLDIAVFLALSVVPLAGIVALAMALTAWRRSKRIKTPGSNRRE